VASGSGRGDPVGEQPDASEATPRFEWVDVYLDSGETGLAAWQIELRAASGDVAIVGIEGGEHPAYAEPPYYDPAALRDGERVVLAAFEASRPVPHGRTRVARVHVRLAGPRPVWELEVQAASSSDGTRLEPEASIVEGSQG